MRNLIIRSFLIFIVSLSCVSVNVLAASAKQIDTKAAVAEVSQEQQQLDRYTQRLDRIQAALAKDNIGANRLDYLYEKTEIILDSAQHIKITATEQLQKSQETLDALGEESVEGDDAQEDAATAKRRQKLGAITALYNGRVKQANAIISQARSLFEDITQKRIQLKAKGLMQRTAMMYQNTVWHNASLQLPQLKQLLKQSQQTMGASLVAHTKSISSFIASVSMILLAVILGIFLRRIANRRIQHLETDALINPLQYLKKLLYYMLINGLLPAIAILLALLPLFFTSTLSDISGIYLQTFIAPLFLLFLGLSFFNVCLTPGMGNWCLFNLTPESAAILLKRIRPFIILLSLNLWFYLLVKSIAVLPDIALITQLIFRLAICINGLLLLSSACWQTVETNNALTSTEPNKQRRFYSIAKLLGFLMFVTNPILTFMGYITLANTLFSNFISTFVVIVSLIMVHHLVSQVLAGVLGLYREKPRAYLQRHFNMTQQRAKGYHFWLTTLLDCALYFSGATLLVLVWGMDPAYLLSTLGLLWYGIEIGGNHLSLLSFFIGIAVFVIVFSGTRFLQRLLSDKVFPNTSLDLGAQHALKTGVGYIGFMLALILCVSAIGFDLSKLAIIVGALSVGIGFGLQNIVSNFVSGIILLIERPIKLGDQIIVAGDEGIVSRISVRATEIRTFDKVSVLVPNSELISGKVKNRTLRDTLTRIEVNVGVAYGSPIQRVKEILLELAKAHPDIVNMPEPFVLFTDFAESALMFSLRAYLRDIGKRADVASELRFSIDECFREENIQIPFPQRDVRVYQMTGDRE